MEEKINFLRSLDSIIIPKDFTYFHHSTSYIPEELKKRMEYGKYIRNWTVLPNDEFTIKGEMSFVERDDRISEAFVYKKALSSITLTYNLPDYSKPFCIRVIIPKINSVRNNLLPIDSDYRKEMELIYRGYGDGRHPKLKNGERIIIIGNSMEDEISEKRIDILYGIRECDIDLYYSNVIKTIKNGYNTSSKVNLSTTDQFGRYINFFPQEYSIAKSNNMDRYFGNPSEFELELLDDYKDEIDNKEILPRIKDHYRYFSLYDNYLEKKNKSIK